MIGQQLGRRTSKIWANLAAGLFVVGNAHAATEPAVPIRVDIKGTNDCHSSDSFLSAVLARTEHARRARDGETGWSANITVKVVGKRRLARLMLMAHEGEWIERELVAPNCENALEALAVVLAVLVDTAVSQSSSSDQRQPEAISGEPPQPIALPRVATGVYIPWIDDPDYFEKRGISLSASRFIARLSASVEVDTQLASRLALGLGFGFEIERWNPNLLRPSFGMGLGWATGDVDGKDGGAAVQRWSLRAFLCPFDLLESRAASLKPCGRLEGGYVYAKVQELSNLGSGQILRYPESSRYGMVRASPYLRLTIAPAAGAQLRIDGGLDLLAIRHDISARNSDGSMTQLHRPPAMGAYVALAVAVEY